MSIYVDGDENHTAGRDINIITNHYYECPKDVFNEETPILEGMLEYCKYKIKQANRKRLYNIPSIIFLILALMAIIFIAFPYILLLIGKVSFAELNNYFPEPITIIIFGIVIIGVAKWGFSKTKYLYPIIQRNKHLIYCIELELEERNL